jgi:hypothetical protein
MKSNGIDFLDDLPAALPHPHRGQTSSNLDLGQRLLNIETRLSALEQDHKAFKTESRAWFMQSGFKVTSVFPSFFCFFVA